MSEGCPTPPQPSGPVTKRDEQTLPAAPRADRGENPRAGSQFPRTVGEGRAGAGEITGRVNVRARGRVGVDAVARGDAALQIHQTGLGRVLEAVFLPSFTTWADLQGARCKCKVFSRSSASHQAAAQKRSEEQL